MTRRSTALILAIVTGVGLLLVLFGRGDVVYRGTIVAFVGAFLLVGLWITNAFAPREEPTRRPGFRGDLDEREALERRWAEIRESQEASTGR